MALSSFDVDNLVKFQELLLDVEKPLYEGCPDFTKLSAILKLLNLKGKYGASDKFFTELLGLIKKMLPAGNEMNDKDLTACQTCGTSRWKVDNKTKKVYENIPAKAWRTIDEKFPEIAEDTRNLRLGISADRVDVNTGNRHHSVWPVLTVIYNLPPWLWVDTYDASTKDNFNLRAVVLWTINDYPALGTLCGCPYSGFKGCVVIKGHVRNRNKPEGCIAEETIAEETIEFFSEYHKSMETIGIPPDKHETYENEEGKPLSADKSSEVSAELFQKAHLQIPLFKYDWVNHKSGGVKRDKLGYTLLNLNNLGHKVDPFVLASQALQVFYVKDPVDKKLSIVFKTPPKNDKDTYDEVDEEFSTVIHHHNDNVLPLVDQRDLANESRDDYYRKDCGGVVIRKSK
ncbi:putative ribonuclease H-like domain-containing protein [Tanacetum coccineum]